MPPEGVLAVVCLDNPRDNTRGKALWTSLPSLGPQEECPWRLSDVIPARMVSHTLRTWTCSHLTWRGQSSRPPAVSPSRVRPTAVSADWHNAPRRQYAIFRPTSSRATTTPIASRLGNTATRQRRISSAGLAPSMSPQSDECARAEAGRAVETLFND